MFFLILVTLCLATKICVITFLHVFSKDSMARLNIAKSGEGVMLSQ